MYRKGETSCALVKNDPVDNGVRLLELAEFPLHEANLKRIPSSVSALWETTFTIRFS